MAKIIVRDAVVKAQHYLFIYDYVLLGYDFRRCFIITLTLLMSFVAGELQQLCGTWWVHAVSPHLWNVTCYLHHRRPTAGRVGCITLSQWLKLCNLQTPAVLCADCYHGIISNHRPLLPGQFRQHRAPLHDPEGAIESSWQAGVTAALPSSQPKAHFTCTFTPTRPHSPPSCPPAVVVHNCRLTTGKALSAFLISTLQMG